MEAPRDNLRMLLEPAGIAIVGASDQPGAGRQVLENLVAVGYSGPVVPINPKYESVRGHRCYPNLTVAQSDNQLIEAVAIVLGREKVGVVLEEAASIGVKAAWAFASGFAEADARGRDLQREISTICNANGIAFCGPNCVGFVNPSVHFGFFSAPLSPSIRSGRAAAVIQSGSIAMALANSARGIGYRFLVSSGNEAVLDSTDYLQFFVEHPDVDVILAFIEQFREPQRFLDVAKLARAAGKPLIILKVGRSKMAQSAAITHTGAIAGSDVLVDAVLRKAAVHRVDDLDEMLETAETFLQLSDCLPTGNRVGVLTVSGGEIGLVGDMAIDLDVSFPMWSERTVQRLAEVLPEYAAVSNPLDAWGSGRIEETFAKTLMAVSEDEVDLLVISLDVPPGLAEEQVRQFATVARSAVAAKRKTGKPIIAISHLSGGLNKTLREEFGKGGIPALQGTRSGLRAVHHLVHHGEAQRRPRFKERDPADRRGEELLGARTGVLDEVESKAILRAYGIPSIDETLCHSLDEGLSAADGLGYPVALKVISSSIPHKTDAGVVKLDIRDAHMLEQSYATIWDNALRHAKADALRGVLVQKMVDTSIAEVILGAKVDPGFGPVVMIGLGGIFVDLLDDRGFAAAPLSREDANELVSATRFGRLVRGFRGRGCGDMEQLIQALVSLSHLAWDWKHRLSAVEINPLLVLPEGEGVVAVDGLIELAPL